MIEDFISKIPSELKQVSGAVFYSGRSAFNRKTSLYILGLNPGGSATKQKDETIALDIDEFLNRKEEDWSAYVDASWGGHTPGTFGLQPRVKHFFRIIGIKPQTVPSSNVCFVRSNREKTISSMLKKYAELCWPFHKIVIEKLGIKVILCFGKASGNFVRNKLKANTKIDQFEEKNNRKWKSLVFENSKGQRVIVATHPSVADWTKPETDPSPLIKRNLLQ